MEEVDISQTAQQLIDKHGDAAASVAMKRADALLSLGDRHGAAVFRKVKRLIEDMNKSTPREGEAVNT